MTFPSNSYFDTPSQATHMLGGAERAPARLITLEPAQIRSWINQVDDVLEDCATGDMRDYERAIQSLDDVRQDLEDVIKSHNGLNQAQTQAFHTDRHSG